MQDAAKCPVAHGANTEAAGGNAAWWPKALNLGILHQHDTKTNPLCADLTTGRSSRSSTSQL